MCGRFTVGQTPLDIEPAFDVSLDQSWEFPRYNIAPSQDVLAITDDGERKAEMLRWGLIPWSTKDPKGGQKPINARGESVVESWQFSYALKGRRCLIVSDSFYEWKTVNSTRVPFRIGLKSWELFAFAGLWERWRSPDGEIVRTCCIVTTAPNALMARIHGRMPVMLSKDAEGLWLDHTAPIADIRELLVPYPATDMDFYQVSPHVNSWQNKDPTCIEPVTTQSERQLSLGE